MAQGRAGGGEDVIDWPWLVAALPALAFGMTVVNAIAWPTPRTRRVSARRRISVLIPARNEAARLPGCLRALAASGVPFHEIIVYDDDSTDDTRSVVERLGREIPGLRLERGVPLPRGWVGKPHACERLSKLASGDLLLFLDADVTLEPDGADRLLAAMESTGADLLTAVPRQVVRSFAERLVVPFLLLTYVSWLPLALVAKTRDPRVVAANGQLLMTTRRALDALGGFAAIAHEIVDDVALCRRAKGAGLRVAFVDGTAVASCRMYRSAREVWAGFSKNICEGVGGGAAVAAVALLYFFTFVLPYPLAAFAWWGDVDALTMPAVAAASLNLAQRAVAAVRWAQPAEGLVTHPLGGLAVVAIAINSFLWNRRGRIRWAGRSYAPRAIRQEAH